jgi:hypothetical protein
MTEASVFGALEQGLTWGIGAPSALEASDYRDCEFYALPFALKTQE